MYVYGEVVMVGAERRRRGVVLVDLPSRIGRHSQKDPFSFSTTPFLFAAQPRTVIEQQHAS